MIHIEYRRLHGWGWRWAAYTINDHGRVGYLGIAMTKRGAEKRLFENMDAEGEILAALEKMKR